ncbi:MAG: inositol monophosphatase family protein [Chloroflexota bacterium]|nr:inositol monophosphatase family protein [Chloroflexota bacterium]
MEAAELQAALDFAADAVWRAGRLTLGYFQTGIAVERKGDNSPVTAADKASEKLFRELIARAYPDDGIIGEEFGEQPGRSGRTWIIDPIDGTKSFVCGVPLYGCLLGLSDGTSPLVGAAYYPALDELIYAGQGLGAWWNGRRASVSKVDKLSDAVLLSSEYKQTFEARLPLFHRLVDATYIQRTWGDSYGYLLVATGRADIMIDPLMWLWDCAPFQVILEEAGGTFTDWKGKPTIYASESVATNGVLFNAVMGLINE